VMRRPSRRQGRRDIPVCGSGGEAPSPRRLTCVRFINLQCLGPNHHYVNSSKEITMDRREMLGVIGGGALGLTALSSVHAQPQHPHHHDPEHGDCLKACKTAAEVCNETFHYSFGHLKDGHTSHARAVELLIDCQDICTLAAAWLSRQSELMAISCAACGEVCTACAEECKKHEDQQLKECVEACLACEKSCRAMVVRLKSGKGRAD
jgi:hypothetical protein